MKKYCGRRVLSLVLMLMMVFSCASPAFAASKKPSLSNKRVTVQVNKTRKLKVKNARKKVKWSTTNKKIAYIKKKSGKRDQKVVIKAGKKAGTCYIKAKVGKKTLKCKVIVKKPAKKRKHDDTPIPEVVIIDGPGSDTDTDREIETRALSASSVDLTEGLNAAAVQDAGASDEFIKGYSDFSLGLLKKTIAADKAEGKNGNILISPDSVAIALAMTENGAAGETLTEMEGALAPGVTSADYNNYLASLNRRLMKSGKYVYNVSNSIWARENTVDVKREFLQTNKNYHDASFYMAPFDDTTVQDINNWVFNKSRNMIDKIIDELDNDARMVLINTIAFEGKWDESFGDPSPIAFTSYDGTKKKVPTLMDTARYQYLEVAGGKGFAKYYKGADNNGGIAFVGILPPAGKDVDQFVSSLSGTDFINAWKNKKSKDVHLTLPEFKYDYSAELSGHLKSLGIDLAFTDDADFSRMADPTPETPALKIDKVFHKTHIELDQDGTKAAASTAVVMSKATACPSDDPIVLKFDRPFVYALVDTKTGIPLFIGEVKELK